jgi:hypothetical protein
VREAVPGEAFGETARRRLLERGEHCARSTPRQTSPDENRGLTQPMAGSRTWRNEIMGMRCRHGAGW